MIDWITQELHKVQDLIELGFLVAAAVIIAMTAWQSRSIIRTLTAALLCGVALWAINNVDWFQQRVNEETTMAPVHVVYDPQAVEVVDKGAV